MSGKRGFRWRRRQGGGASATAAVAGVRGPSLARCPKLRARAESPPRAVPAAQAATSRGQREGKRRERERRGRARALSPLLSPRPPPSLALLRRAANSCRRGAPWPARDRRRCSLCAPYRQIPVPGYMPGHARRGKRAREQQARTETFESSLSPFALRPFACSRRARALPARAAPRDPHHRRPLLLRARARPVKGPPRREGTEPSFAFRSLDPLL